MHSLASQGYEAISELLLDKRIIGAFANEALLSNQPYIDPFKQFLSERLKDLVS